MNPEIAINWTVFGLALALGHTTAWLFNGLVHRIGEEQEGFTWLLVVAGVAMTLGLSLFVVPWEFVGILLAFFAATGLPMIAGDIFRAKMRSHKARGSAKNDAIRMANEVAHGQDQQA